MAQRGEFMCVAGTWSATLTSKPHKPWWLSVRGKVMAEFDFTVTLERLPPKIAVGHDKAALYLEVIFTPPDGSASKSNPIPTPPLLTEHTVTFKEEFAGLSVPTFTHIVIANCNNLTIPLTNPEPPKKL